MKKVLIVDDSPAQIALMQAVLEQNGYRPVAINDPLRLEAAIEMERPELILMDVVMPGRNGFQACREIKNSVEFARIPVILVSSKDSDSDKFWAQQQGADGYVVKPFTSETLMTQVKRFV